MNKRSSLSGKKNREKAVNTVCFLLVVFFSALCLLPIWWIFRSSLMTNNQLYSSNVPSLPPDWLFSNYTQALKNFPFWMYLKNTLTIIVPSVIAGTVTAVLGGYAFARMRFPGKKFLFTLVIGSMFLPVMVTLIPLYIMWTNVLRLNGVVRTNAAQGFIFFDDMINLPLGTTSTNH